MIAPRSRFHQFEYCAKPVSVFILDFTIARTPFSPYKNCLTSGVYGPWSLISGNLSGLVAGSCCDRIVMRVLLAYLIFITTLFESHIILIPNTTLLLFIAQQSLVTSRTTNFIEMQVLLNTNLKKAAPRSRSTSMNCTDSMDSQI